MKQLFLLFFSLFLSNTILGQTAIAPQGTGSSTSPYLISNLGNLYWISQNASSWDKYFLQTADINASATANWTGGFPTIGAGYPFFTGQYDGDNHVIDSITIASSQYEGGLFGRVRKSTLTIPDVGIKNLGVSNGTVSNSSTLVGGIAAYLVNGATIENCWFTGTLTGTSSFAVGGIVAGVDGSASLVNQCWTDCDIYGGSYTGGIAGEFRGIMKDCYTTADIHSGSNIGGLCGSVYTVYGTGKLERCYASGTVPVNKKALVGTTGSTSPIFIDLYYNSTTYSGLASGVSSGASGLTSSQMQSSANFTNFDFSSTWVINSTNNNGWPTLTGILCQSNTGVDSIKSCDTLTWIDGVTYTTSNSTATHTLINQNGCDSIVTLFLTITSSNSGIDTISACDSYTWIDGVTYTASNSAATHTLTNQNGCDSVVTLFLTITSSNSGIDTISACDSYTWIDGLTYSASNSAATHTLTNRDGCDSVVTLNLTITSSNAGTDVITACDSYTWIDGLTYTTSNSSATYTLTNQDGCDSVVSLNLTITNSNTGIDSVTACDTYTWIDGVTYTASNNTANHTLINQYGCDSIVTLNLIIYTSPLVDAGPDEVICVGETIVLNAIGGSTFIWSNSNQNGDTITPSSTGHLYVTGTDMNGCSTIDSLSITVNPLPMVVAGLNQSICPGTSTTLTATGAQVFSWNNGVINAVAFTPDSSSIYNVTGTDSNGCSNVDSVYIALFNVQDIQLPSYGLLCDNYPNLNLSDSSSGYTFTGDHISNNIFNVVAAGSGSSMIYITNIDTNGCVVMDTTYLTVEPSPPLPEITRVSALVIQTTQAFDRYQWYRQGQIINGETLRSLFVTQGGNYKVQVTNTAGCTSQSAPFFVGYIGLNEIGNSNINIFPNPTSESFNIDLRGIEDQLTLTVIDDAGRLLTNEKLESNVINAIDVAHFKSGTYIVHLISETGQIVNMNLKVVK